MKKLLLFSFLVMGVCNSFAQLTCATATAITADGTITVPTITGTYLGTCAPNGNGTGQNAIWYSYTATADGEVTLNADLPQNDGATNSDDTRVSVFTGTCTTLACYAGADDISDTNYLTAVTFPVQSGVIYLIQWDDRWSDKTFDFDFSFAVVDCVGVNGAGVQAPTNVTVDSAQLNFAVGIGSPASYDIEYGVAGFVPGSGIVVNTTTNSVTISGLTPSVTYEYYIRNNCGATQSSYAGPFFLYLAETLPYSNSFDDPLDYGDGFTQTGGWGLGQTAGAAQSGNTYFFSNSSTTAATNAYLYTKAIALQANEQVTLTFYTRAGTAAGSPLTLKVFVNTTATPFGAAQLGTDIIVSGITYAQQTRTFTAATAGTYYFIFNNATAIVATATSLRFDTVVLTSVLGTNDFLSSKFSVYPNPANNVISFSNDASAVISSVEMTDLNGRTVKYVKVNAIEGQISVSDLATGMYMMKITTDQGVATKKIVKQ